MAFESFLYSRWNGILNVGLSLCYFKLERLILLETQKLVVIINIWIRYYTLVFNPKYISANNNLVCLCREFSRFC